MAHIAKYKASAVGKLCAHYNRWDGIDNPNVSRENIDKERTPLNYTLGAYEKDGERYIGKVPGTASWTTVKGRIDAVNAAAKAEGKRAVRKDAVVMADMVVTLPPNVPAKDAYRFFWNSYQYIADLVGRDNLMGGYVHMDETTPHMHVPFTPILDGRFNYKKMCDRKFYQTFHKGLGDRLERKMGYRPEVELSGETRAQRVYTSRTKDIDKVRDAVDRAVVRPAEDEAARIVAAAKEEAAALLSEAEAQRVELDNKLSDVQMDIDEQAVRLESLRQREGAERAAVAELERAIEQARAQPARETVAESAGALWKGRGAGSREEGLRGEIEGLRGRVWELERANQDARERLAGLDERVRELRERVQGAFGRLDALRGRVWELVSGLLRVPDTLSDLALDMAEDMGKPVYSPNSLDELCARATAAARAYNEGRYERGEVPEPRRTWSR